LKKKEEALILELVEEPEGGNSQVPRDAAKRKGVKGGFREGEVEAHERFTLIDDRNAQPDKLERGKRSDIGEEGTMKIKRMGNTERSHKKGIQG